jgi:hypothetical protein
MANLKTFDVDDSLPFLRIDWLYTLARLLKSLHTAAFVPAFQALGPTLDAAIKTQTELEDALTTATAARDIADADLRQLVLQIVHALLMVAKNNRQDPLVVSYLGSQTPGEIVQPALGTELATVAAWIEPLKKETDTTLQAFGTTLDAQVAVGRTAEKDVKAARKALRDFRLIGQRKKATDALNAARGNLLGLLLKFQHENPQLRLHRKWATGFFRHAEKVVAKYGATVEQAEERLARLQEELEAAKAHLSELQKKAAAHEEARKKRAEARAALAAAHKADKAQKKQQKVLEAEAEKKLKRK